MLDKNILDKSILDKIILDEVLFSQNYFNSIPIKFSTLQIILINFQFKFLID